MNSTTYNITDIQDSKDLAVELASNLKAGDIITFSGDLGSGKTFLCREIIRFFCGDDTKVSSPSFSLLQLYKTKDWQIYHYDFYRLKSVDELYELGIDEAFSNNVCLIEWPEVAKHLLPLPRIDVELVFNGISRWCVIQHRNSVVF